LVYHQCIFEHDVVVSAGNCDRQGVSELVWSQNSADGWQFDLNSGYISAVSGWWTR